MAKPEGGCENPPERRRRPGSEHAGRHRWQPSPGMGRVIRSDGGTDPVHRRAEAAGHQCRDQRRERLRGSGRRSRRHADGPIPQSLSRKPWLSPLPSRRSQGPGGNLPWLPGHRPHQWPLPGDPHRLHESSGLIARTCSPESQQVPPNLWIHSLFLDDGAVLEGDRQGPPVAAGLAGRHPVGVAHQRILTPIMLPPAFRSTARLRPVGQPPPAPPPGHRAGGSGRRSDRR